MKNYFDGFYELIHKNSVKRRRMFSLLLVLSIFVSSGVLWELRDTVITMVNEPLCGFEEHEHTDECYEKILVCGLEENDEHTHTEECYEKVLKCGHEEHIHIPLCYTDEEKEAEDEAVINEESAFALGNVPEDDIVDDEELVDVELPELTLDNGIEVLADDSSLPATIQTIDNIAEGIKFTLFDYGDSNLESPVNKYVWKRVDPTEGNSGYWMHPQSLDSKTEGWKDSGINSGRNPDDDILFFSMGTPVDSSLRNPDAYNSRDGEGKTIKYVPDKNSYSGDYNANPQYPGNRPVSGIVKSDLGSDGYPIINNAKGNSLAYLFKPDVKVDVDGNTVDQTAYKKVYPDVNHLLKKDERGHLVYNSNVNYAYFNKDTYNFEVYEKTFEIVNENHHAANTTDGNKTKEDGSPVEYTTAKDDGFMIGFFPFDQYDESRKDPNFDGDGYNHHFGMTMEAKFYNPTADNLPVNTNTEKKEPVTFKYSGDDDMWVFVDNKLVLDIGGIHEPAGGMIDFTNGLVWVQDNGYDGETLDEVKTFLIYNNFIGSEADWNDLPKPIGIDTSSSTSDGNKWIVTPISNYISVWDSKKIGEHEIKMFYLERGGCYSNLAMDMNLPTLKPLTVFKNVDYKSHLVKDFDNDEYEFQVWEWDINGNKWIIPQDTNPNAPYYLKDNNFKIKAGERKEFKDLGQDRIFKVVEVGVDPNKFDEVTIETAKGTETKTLNGGGLTDVSLDNVYKLSEANAYTFNNSIREETTKVTVKKKWDPANSKPNDFKMKYKIIRTDLATNEEKQVALLENDKKVRTFVLENEEGETKEGLLSRYGDHYYSYRVEELNVPMNFNASYKEIVGQDGTVIEVTNKDDSKVDIYVKKEWENVSDTKPAVQLVLKRESVGYEESKPTDLKITILDEGGNLIKTETISVNDTNKIYAGGSAEISYMLPNGVKLYKGDSNYPQKKIAGEDNPKIISNNNSPNDKLYVKFEEEDNILVVENLAAKEGSGIANEVTFKVTSDNAEDSLLLLHHSFTRGTNGWGVQNDAVKQNGQLARIASSKRVDPYAKDDAVVITDRTKSFNGATLSLDPALFKVNKTYTFSVYIYSQVADRFKITFNNGLGEYIPINRDVNGGYFDVPANKWTQISGSLKLSENIDPYNMFIVVESEPVTKNGDKEACKADSFWMDEFTAIEGTMPVTVDADTGVVRIGEAVSSGGQVYRYEFNGLGDGWTVHDYQGDHTTQTESPGNDTNGRYVIVSNRDMISDGIVRQDVSFLQPGHTYKFKVGAQREGANSADDVHLTLYVPGGVDYNGQRTDYPYVSGIIDISRDDTQQYPDYVWGENEGYEITIPSDADISRMYMYFETSDNTNNKTGPFRIRYVEVTEVDKSSSASDLPKKDGYKIENGQYVSDFSNYVISLDKNSVTNPLYLTGDYVKEYWSKTVTLTGGADEWKYHWSKDSTNEENKLYEENNKLYRYWIEEVQIGQDNAIRTTTNLSKREVISENSDYIISYSKDFVPTNTEETPILVKNEYMWYKLPPTGGSGTGRIYFLGGIFTAIGIISGSVFYRRKRRRV